MRAVVQRVSQASVHVEDELISRIGPGMLVLLGVSTRDDQVAAERLAAKILKLRIFEDPAGRMNLDISEAGGAILCVSQFTLYGTVRRGNRPSFDLAAGRESAEPLYERFCALIEAGQVECKRGVFGAEMAVALENDGPVTLVIDTEELDAPRGA